MTDFHAVTHDLEKKAWVITSVCKKVANLACFRVHQKLYVECSNLDIF